MVYKLSACEGINCSGVQGALTKEKEKERGEEKEYKKRCIQKLIQPGRRHLAQT